MRAHSWTVLNRFDDGVRGANWECSVCGMRRYVSGLAPGSDPDRRPNLDHLPEESQDCNLSVVALVEET